MKIAVGFAGPDIHQITREFGIISNDENMSLSLLQSNWDLLIKSLDEGEPDLLIVYADIAPGVDTLVELLSRLKNALAIVLLPVGWADIQGTVEKVHTVRAVYVLPVASAEVLKRGYNAVQTELSKRKAISPLGSEFSRGGRSALAVGTRVIAFVSAQGGVGKSTLAEGLGFELVARRNINSLIFSFDLPSLAPMRFGINYQPSAHEYFAQPGPAGFKDSLQTTKDGLDVVVAPSESYYYASMAEASPEEARSIRSLVITSYAFQYGAILLDLPAGQGAWTMQPLLAANLVLILSRPTLDGVRATAHIARLLTEELHVNHRIPKEGIYVILNQRTKNSSYTASSFHHEGNKYSGWFPPVLTTIDFDPTIAQAQDASRPAVNASEDLSKNVAGLADTLFGDMRNANHNGHFKGRSFLGIRIRMGG
jgi:MinD-like ATPase involved in chromosome partitioning or flagellar assembly